MDCCAQNRKEDCNFCAGCGKKLKDLKCPECDFVVQSTDNFCKACGHNLKGVNIKPTHTAKKPPNQPFVFIPGPAEDCTDEDKHCYLDYLDNELIPMLDRKNVPYRNEKHLKPGSKYHQLQDLQEECTFVIVPLCPAICTPQNVHIIGKNFTQKNPIVLEISRNVCREPNKEWAGLSLFHCYNCDNSNKLEETVEQIFGFLYPNDETLQMKESVIPNVAIVREKKFNTSIEKSVSMLSISNTIPVNTNLAPSQKPNVTELESSEISRSLELISSPNTTLTESDKFIQKRRLGSLADFIDSSNSSEITIPVKGKEEIKMEESNSFCDDATSPVVSLHTGSSATGKSLVIPKQKITPEKSHMAVDFETETSPSRTLSQFTSTTRETYSTHPDRSPYLDADVAKGSLLPIPVPFRKAKVLISPNEERKICTEIPQNYDSFQHVLDSIYDADPGRIKGILNNMDPAMIIRYILQNCQRLQKNPKYLVSLVSIATNTSYREVILSAMSFLSVGLTCIGGLDITTMGEVKSIYSKIVPSESDQPWCMNTDHVSIDIVSKVLLCCRLCAMWLLIHAISYPGTEELKFLQNSIKNNIIMADKWKQKGFFGDDHIDIGCQIETIRDVYNTIQTTLLLEPSKRSKLLGISEILVNFSKVNKSAVSSVLKHVGNTEKLAILMCVCSLVLGNKDNRYKDLLQLVHKDVSNKRPKSVHGALVALHSIVTTIERLDNKSDLSLMQPLLSSTLKTCKDFFNKDYFEQYVVPNVSCLLFHSCSELREFVAKFILPYDKKSKKSNYEFQQRTMIMLHEFNRKCIERDLMLYRVTVSANERNLANHMEDCFIYSGKFGNMKSGVEVLCLKQRSINEITNPTSANNYEKMMSRITNLQKLHSTKGLGGTFGSDKNIVTLLALMCPGNGINYYLIHTGQVSECLSTYLKQKMLNEPAKHMPFGKRLQLAKDVVSAVMHCNYCNILVRNITASAFIVCKENGQRIAKLYNLESAMLFSTEDGVTVDEEEDVPTMWLAPESVYKSQYNSHTEAYSLAHTILEILSYGVHPYQEMRNMEASKKLITVLKYRLLPERRPCIAESLYIQLLSCFLKDPRRRTNLYGIYQLLRTTLQNRDQDLKMNSDSTNVIKELLRSQPNEPERGIPKDLQHIGSEEDFIEVKDETEKNYEDYIFQERFNCVVQESDFTCHDRPMMFDPSQQGQISLCIDKKHSTREEMFLIRDISKVKDSKTFIASVKKSFPVPQELCHLKHTALIMNIGQRQPLIDIIVSQKLSGSQKQAIYCDIATGMKYLHDKDLIHCSLQGKYIYAQLRCDTVDIVIGQLNRMTQLKEDVHDTDITEALARPFDPIPKDIRRWCPLETLETGLMSVYSDVAQYGHTLWEIEMCNGVGIDVPKKYLVPYPHIPIERLADAHRQKHMLPQGRDCPDWLDRLIKLCIANPKCRRPLFGEIIAILKARKPEENEMLYPKPAPIVNKRSIIDGVDPIKKKRCRSDLAKVLSGAFNCEDVNFFGVGTVEHRRNSIAPVQRKTPINRTGSNSNIIGRIKKSFFKTNIENTFALHSEHYAAKQTVQDDSSYMDIPTAIYDDGQNLRNAASRDICGEDDQMSTGTDDTFSCDYEVPEVSNLELVEELKDGVAAIKNSKAGSAE